MGETYLNTLKFVINFIIKIILNYTHKHSQTHLHLKKQKRLLGQLFYFFSSKMGQNQSRL